MPVTQAHLEALPAVTAAKAAFNPAALAALLKQVGDDAPMWVAAMTQVAASGYSIVVVVQVVIADLPMLAKEFADLEAVFVTPGKLSDRQKVLETLLRMFMKNPTQV